ncbi:hypothetical protein SAMN02745216_05005 [Desulfatibacillum alkenivorans DSM 16219]|jgi:hypothetical protein|uniref:Uncharacterized protein n=1 Tax=Desulfatibacillum alkenivorans DSM 16219 TaxID=1121393 RepID=A0A1M6ZMN4_9BACT|nr:hypothetical protein SAMN02745216_05005 [Desulfatibacillum alkenivorans DSM 16219]
MLEFREKKFSGGASGKEKKINIYYNFVFQIKSQYIFVKLLRNSSLPVIRP